VTNVRKVATTMDVRHALIKDVEKNEWKWFYTRSKDTRGDFDIRLRTAPISESVVVNGQCSGAGMTGQTRRNTGSVDALGRKVDATLSAKAVRLNGTQTAVSVTPRR
jgi:hypothetical protein